MLERTLIYVDTSYLLASFYNSWDTGARSQLEIDLPEVVSVLNSMATNQLKQPVHRQFWYDGIPDAGPHRYQRSLRSEPGVQLRAGQLIEWGDRRTQKAVDTRLVADMVIASTKAEFSDMILVSGDADMLPGVEEAVNAGIRVHLYGFGWDSMSSALRFACDTTTIIDPREDFRNTMRLQILEGPMPPTVNTAPNDGEGSTDTEATSEDNGRTPPPGQQDFAPHPGEKPLGDAEAPETPGPTAIPTFEDANQLSPAEARANMPNVPLPGEQDPSAVEGEKAASEAEKPADKPTITPGAMPGAAEAAGAEAKPQDGEAHQAEAKPQGTQHAEATSPKADEGGVPKKSKPTPNPSMMARHRKLRSRYVPLPNEVWASAGEQSPYDIGQQYAIWWFDNAANEEQKDDAHLLSGGGLPPNIDRPLLQFACETLHEYTLTESQRVGLRDGFHAGIRGIMLREV